jgi:hypothetical protein
MLVCAQYVDCASLTTIGLLGSMAVLVLAYVAEILEEEEQGFLLI